MDIAYQVFGNAPPDLLVLPGPFVPVDTIDAEPSMYRFHRRLASFSRVIRFDQRGIGLASRVPSMDVVGPTFWAEDAIAVMDAVGCQQATIFASNYTGMSGLVLAADYPERVRGLVIVNGAARTLWAPDYPVGTEGNLADPFMTVATEPDAVEQGDSSRFVPVGHGRYLAEHIARSRYVELPGADALYWVGDTAPLLDEIEDQSPRRVRGSCATAPRRISVPAPPLARVISHTQSFSSSVACPRALRGICAALAQLISDNGADRLAVITVIRHVAAHSAQLHRAPPDDGGPADDRHDGGGVNDHTRRTRPQRRPVRPALPHHRHGDPLEVVIRLDPGWHRVTHLDPTPKRRRALVVARLERETPGDVLQAGRSDDLPGRLDHLRHRLLVGQRRLGAVRLSWKHRRASS
jgi:hypothetical protein